jgi:hypothetical protein
VEKEAPGRGACVDAVGQALEVNLALRELANEMNEISDASSQAVELPNHKYVPSADKLQRAGQAGSFCTHGTHLVFEDFLSTGLLERFPLKIQVLVLGGDAGVTD